MAPMCHLDNYIHYQRPVSKRSINVPEPAKRDLSDYEYSQD
jgi:hypothetical protein